MSSVRACSLLELIMVLATTAMISVTAIPRYPASTTRYRAAAHRIEADLRLARDRARLASEDVTVTVDAKANTLAIPSISGLNDPAACYLTNLKMGPDKADIVSVTFDGENDVTFDGFGCPGSGGIIVVRAGSVTRKLLLEMHTGEMDIQ